MKRILVKVSSPRQRGALMAYISNKRPWCSFRQDAGAGTFEVTAVELAALKVARKASIGRRAFRFSVVRKPEDFFHCWTA
jgi:hypothetical protein